jgi:hypothetical protein
VTRLPQIGDSVRREGEDHFEGYISNLADDQCQAFALDAPETIGGQYEYAEAQADQDRYIRIVPILFLVRGLHGWRWAPFDGRPQVGDAILSPIYFPNGVKAARQILAQAPGPEKHAEWQVVGQRGGAGLSQSDVAKAVAGLEGWSWEPARWSALKETT